jgi:DNA-binding PadR family transcriptional regulator
MALAQAILAVLSDRACSGYDLAKQFDGSVGFFWKASHQQIYRELTQLEGKLWVELEVMAQNGRPDRKVYSITAMGIEALRDWIIQPSPLPGIKDALLIKLFAGHTVPTEAIRTLMQNQQTQHLETLETYRTIERTYFANPDKLSIERRFQYLTLRNGIHIETGWLAWYEEAMGAIDQFPSA